MGTTSTTCVLALSCRNEINLSSILLAKWALLYIFFFILLVLWTIKSSWWIVLLSYGACKCLLLRAPLWQPCFFVMSSRVPPWGWQPHGVAELRSLLVLCPGLGHSPRTQGFPLNAGRRWSVCLRSHSCHPSTCNHSRYTKRNSLYSLLVFLKAVRWIFVSSSNCIFSSWYLLKSWTPPHAPSLRILGLWRVFSFAGCISMPGADCLSVDRFGAALGGWSKQQTTIKAF